MSHSALKHDGFFLHFAKTFHAVCDPMDFILKNDEFCIQNRNFMNEIHTEGAKPDGRKRRGSDLHIFKNI